MIGSATMMSEIAVKVLTLIAAFALGIGLGVVVTSSYKNAQNKAALDDQEAIYNKLINNSRDEKEAADKHADDVEHASIARLADLDKQFQEELQNETAKRDKIIADLKSGNKRLFVSVKSPAACGSGALPGTTASASVSNDSTRAELSTNIAERLVRRASLANEITMQLGQCQAIITSDRQLLNGVIPPN